VARLFRRQAEGAVALLDVPDTALGDPPKEGPHDGIVRGVGNGELEGTPARDVEPRRIVVPGASSKASTASRTNLSRGSDIDRVVEITASVDSLSQRPRVASISALRSLKCQ